MKCYFHRGPMSRKAMYCTGIEKTQFEAAVAAAKAQLAAANVELNKAEIEPQTTGGSVRAERDR